MTSAAPSRAVLDSDVIFSRVLHELLGRIATELRLLTLVWSDELRAEAEHTLTHRKPMPALAARRWAGYLRDAFPDQRINLAHLPTGVDLATLTDDPDDQHICALPIAGRADLLVTFGQDFRPESLRQHGFEVIAPDELLSAAFGDEPVALLRAQAAAWGGGRPVTELLDAVARARAPQFVAKVRARLAS